jgi:hypothetical protein
MVHISRGIALLSGILALGCVEEQAYVPWRVRPVTGPDGTKSWAIVTCVESKANCYEAAAATCSTGYDVSDETDHSQTSQVHRSFVGGGESWAAGHSRTDSVEHFRQEWLIHCRPFATSASTPPPAPTPAPAPPQVGENGTLPVDP